ncbi:hypothetical protein ACF073_03325 [Streptomyces sp. NPDC015171]|uniref:hypothetical protein n=1 Tax=Streptomyces sp. NPDC015171 TaxID=3364945 RepID=UPI0036F8CF04
MFSSKKIAVVSALVGGLAVICTGITQAQAAAGPGSCARDLLGGISCTQRIKGEFPDDAALVHQETCKPVERLTLPAALGGGQTRFGPEITCNPETVGVAPESAVVPEATGGQP